MNIERLTEIAEWLEAGAPEKAGVVEFDMSDFVAFPAAFVEGEMRDDWEPSCGTAACIAGAAVQFDRARHDVEPITPNLLNGDRIYLEAAELLGLEEYQAEELFIPSVAGSWAEITPAWAARVIREFIATGEIDWHGMKATP